MSVHALSQMFPLKCFQQINVIQPCAYILSSISISPNMEVYIQICNTYIDAILLINSLRPLCGYAVSTIRIPYVDYMRDTWRDDGHYDPLTFW